MKCLEIARFQDFAPNTPELLGALSGPQTPCRRSYASRRTPLWKFLPTGLLYREIFVSVLYFRPFSPCQPWPSLHRLNRCSIANCKAATKTGRNFIPVLSGENNWVNRCPCYFRFHETLAVVYISFGVVG